MLDCANNIWDLGFGGFRECDAGDGDEMADEKAIGAGVADGSRMEGY
jgi:hypothetical protein